MLLYLFILGLLHIYNAVVYVLPVDSEGCVEIFSGQEVVVCCVS